MIPFFLKCEGFTIRPPSFYSPHQMTPYFSFVLIERPHFSLFSLSPKDPYFGGLVPTSPSLPYVSATPPCLYTLKYLLSRCKEIESPWSCVMNWKQTALHTD